MGHREDLLTGAAQCLYEKGFGQTTARDVVAASRTNLASIGYHFGSKDALLTEAAVRTAAEWNEELDKALARVDPTAAPAERMEQTWIQVVELFRTHRRLWVTYIETLAQAGRMPRLREVLADAQGETREELASMFHALPEDPDAADRQGHVLGSFYQALLTGVMMQWLLDPQNAPTGTDISEALRLLTSPESLPV
ncbi:MAG: hypothetical protein QOJ30_3706 [Pseudonocardiales bacterium]|nr:hypothetical protein [Pseudonocardiales bacterium]